ncbi:hypothetical protein GO986_12215 [Deinococcus sp. HMF7620]|uniref:Uncharacterized protein n=1 Tax=Deinococcus arboris TaxID=2682977 RepID=A0A7C9HYV5_9DEIO|nr:MULTISPECIES: hypothetical protein [Deinococcus]MBZ9752217.1 hypothetical protein [Deinococcus betulae]MVN87530.1 hypothetical protein [Deinococcus arboris]
MSESALSVSTAPAFVLVTPHTTYLAHCATEGLAERAAAVLNTHYGPGSVLVQPATGQERDAQGCALELLSRDQDTELVVAAQATLDVHAAVFVRNVHTLRGLVWDGLRLIQGIPVASTLCAEKTLALMEQYLPF